MQRQVEQQSSFCWTQNFVRSPDSCESLEAIHSGYAETSRIQLKFAEVEVLN